MDNLLIPESIRTNIIFFENLQKSDTVFQCTSLEGALQSLKFDKPHIAIEVCKLAGLAAKFRGKKRNKQWKSQQTLWFFGVPMTRKSDEYQKVLDFIYISLFLQNETFRNDLKATGDAVFTHSMGNNKESETVLTEREFCSRLTKLRSCLSDNQSDVVPKIKKVFNIK